MNLVFTKIKTKRKDRHLSLEALAKLSGVSAPLIHRMEVGKAKLISLENLEKIAKSLECSAYSLFPNEINDNFQDLKDLVSKLDDSVRSLNNLIKNI